MDQKSITRWANSHDPFDLFSGDQLDEFCHLPSSIDEALQCLKSGTLTIHAVAKQLAVSTRTLQREVRKHTGKSPYFWLSLARIRRTCRSLLEFDRLSDAAAAFGFSDQVHMTRETVRWFGVTPGFIKPGSEVFNQLRQSGYG